MQAQVEAETKELATKVAQVKKERAVSTQAPKPMKFAPQWSASAYFGLQLCSSRPMHHIPVLADFFIIAAPVHPIVCVCVSRPAAV